MKRHESQTAVNRSRSGFSLIELLVVIVIIGILMSLILPAIASARRAAQITSVATEITQIDQAITTFKGQYGIEPPSSLVIPAAGAAWGASDRAKVLAIWPQFNFVTNGGLGNPAKLSLSGAECLVFFLGGLESGSTAAPTLAGFSKNPATPWTMGGGTRNGPYFEFDSGRIVDVDGDNLFEYLDSLPGQQTPYFYLSSQGKSYKRANTAGAELDDFDVFPDAPAAFAAPNSRNMSFAYLKSDGATPQRANSYQIVSPGLDATYGVGGVFNNGDELVNLDLNGDGDKSDLIDGDSDGVLEVTDKIEPRGSEADNITNFSNGRMKP
jgi:prepilin-type N-terminal cleavage/methylation domain-containing protein